MKKYLIVFVLVILLSVYLLTPKLSTSQPSQIESVTPSTFTSPMPSPIFDSDEDFYRYFLKSKGLIAVQSSFERLTGWGKQAILIATGEGCGSCHYNEIHIFDERKEIFTFYGEDTKLTPIDGKGFTIIQPLLKEGQSYSNRNEFQSATYTWDGNVFLKTKTSLNWVDMPQAPE